MELYNDDCLNVMRTMADGSVDLIVTDPPYKTITGGDCNGKNSERPKGMLGGAIENCLLIKIILKYQIGCLNYIA